MPIQAPQWSEYLSCTLCYNDFDIKLRRPVSLACGHTVCKTCLFGLHCKQCPFDQTVINVDVNTLPENIAILQLVNGYTGERCKARESTKELSKYFHSKEEKTCYENSSNCIENIALFLKPSQSAKAGNSESSVSILSRSMQRKVVALINCQLLEDEGRSRSSRGARSLGERVVTELILQHQNPQQLCANLWAAVRARGCQFLGPAMQEEVLKLILLALEEGCALSRKVLVMFVVQRLEPHFPQASKTSIGHVVQLLYRASCFIVFKREGDSSLMQLKEEFRSYDMLRREHDAQIVQIATEAGLRIAPDQWSSLLYADTAHKSHMQSIMDKLQTPQSFGQSVQELVIALQRTGDPGALSMLQPHLEFLSSIDPNRDDVVPSWSETEKAMLATKEVVHGLTNFLKNHSTRKLHDHAQSLNNKYKTSMCRDFTQRGFCPRAANCTFAHSQEEMEKYRVNSKKGGNYKPINVAEDSSAKEVDSAIKKTNKVAAVTKEFNTSDNVVNEKMVSRMSSLTIAGCGNDVTFNHSVHVQPKTAVILSTVRPDAAYPDIDHSVGNISASNISWTQPAAVNAAGQLLAPTGLPPGVNPNMNQGHHGGSVLYQSFPSIPGQSQATLIALPPPQLPTVAPSPVPNMASQAVGVFPAGVTPTGFHANIQPAQLVSTGPGQPVALAPALPGTPVEETISVISPTCYDPNTGYQLWQGNNYRGSVYTVMNVESIQPDISETTEKLAYLEKRKIDLLCQLDKEELIQVKNLSNSKTLKSSVNQNDKKLIRDAIEQDQLSKFSFAANKHSYSPWTSSGFTLKIGDSSCSSSITSSAADFVSTVVSPSSASHIITDKDGKCVKKKRAQEIFSSSEDDQFIPFDPPLVSRFGPISRMARSMIRGPAPIQVSANLNCRMTTITPVMQQPVPAASPVPSWYFQSPQGVTHIQGMSARVTPLESLVPMQKGNAIPVFINESLTMNTQDNVKFELMHLNKEINDLKVYKEQMEDYSNYFASNNSESANACNQVQVNCEQSQQHAVTSTPCHVHTSVITWDRGMLEVEKKTEIPVSNDKESVNDAGENTTRNE